jgi:hypothetical protein
MRQISVSTDTYAAIWGDRRPGEDDEEAILRRKFGVSSKSVPPAATTGQMKAGGIGFRDSRFGIELPEGFEIFRVYLGTEYRAKAINGKWVLQSDGREFPSLNQLSQAIGARTENAWQNWYYRGGDGKRCLVSALRK